MRTCLIGLLLWFIAIGPVPAMAQSEEDPAFLEQQLKQLLDTGRYQEALPVAERRAVLAEKLHGANDNETLDARTDVATTCYRAGDIPRAVQLFEQVLPRCEQRQPPDPELLADVLNNLGLCYQKQGHLDQALGMFQRSLAIEKVSAQTAESATRVDNIGALYLDMGRLFDARDEITRAFTMLRKHHGLKHQDTLECLNNVGVVCIKLGCLEPAWAAFDLAVPPARAALGPDHPLTLKILANEATVLGTRGDLAAAVTLLRQVREAQVRTLGPTHPDTLSTTSGLATDLFEMGNLAECTELKEQVLAGCETVYGADGLAVSDACSELADCYVTSDPTRAEALLKRAIDILTRQAPTSVERVQDQIVLAQLYHHLGRSDEALAITYQAAESAANMGLQPIALVESELGDLLADTGHLAEATGCLQVAVDATEALYGPDNNEVATCLFNLAWARLEAGQGDDALNVARRAARVRELRLAHLLSFTSEGERLQYLATAEPYNVLGDLGSATDLAQAVLHYKGVVLDSLLEDVSVAQAGHNPATRALARALETKKAELALLEGARPQGLQAADAERRGREQHALEQGVADLQGQLATHAVPIGRSRRALSVTPSQVQAALPTDAVLVEFLQYQHLLGRGKGFERHYGAVLIPAHGVPRWVPLDKVTAVDDLVAAYQQALRSGHADDATMGLLLKALYRRVWQPVAASLPAGTHQVVVAPDGALSFCSFATLLGPDDRFVAQSLLIRYVVSGRDLLAPKQVAPGRKMVLLGNPAFDATLAGPSVTGVPGVALRSAADMVFTPLPGTARECSTLATLALRSGWQAVVYGGTAASEAQVRGLRSPSIVHLATHGFMLANPTSSPVNPMRRSGLALSSATTTVRAWAHGEVPASDRDGVLLAEEVATLDWHGTWLVTLSACDTGSGEVASGEGVMGLRRSFLQAGVENLVVTLWPVLDVETADFMGDFYRRVWAQGDPAAALAQTQRDWLVRLRKSKGLAAAVAAAGPFICTSRGRPGTSDRSR